MTLNQKLRQALEPLGLRLVPDVDTAHGERGCVLHYDLRPVQTADNAPLFYKALVQVHLFLPLEENGIALVGRAVRAVAAAGCTWPEVVDASDETGQHKVLECEYLIGKDDL